MNVYLLIVTLLFLDPNKPPMQKVIVPGSSDYTNTLETCMEAGSNTIIELQKLAKERNTPIVPFFNCVELPKSEIEKVQPKA